MICGFGSHDATVLLSYTLGQLIGLAIFFAAHKTSALIYRRTRGIQ